MTTPEQHLRAFLASIPDVKAFRSDAILDPARNGYMLTRELIESVLAELDRLRAAEDWTDRVSLPDAQREIEHQKAGKLRWRGRAEAAEARLGAVRRLIDLARPIPASLNGSAPIGWTLDPGVVLGAIGSPTAADQRQLDAHCAACGHRTWNTTSGATPCTCPPGPVIRRCCVCGTTKHGGRTFYENYRGQLFCWPCADGDPLCDCHQPPTRESQHITTPRLEQMLNLVDVAKEANRAAVIRRDTQRWDTIFTGRDEPMQAPTLAAIAKFADAARAQHDAERRRLEHAITTSVADAGLTIVRTEPVEQVAAHPGSIHSLRTAIEAERPRHALWAAGITRHSPFAGDYLAPGLYANLPLVPDDTVPPGEVHLRPHSRPASDTPTT